MIIIIFLTILALFSCLIIDSFYSESHSESCGHVFNVPMNTHYDNRHCRDPSYELVCENNRSVLYVNYGRHLVHAIYASNSSTSILQSVTAGIDNNNCSAITRHSLTYSNFSHAFTDEKYHYYGGELLFVSCENPVHSPSYVESMAACASEAPKSLYSYVLTGHPIIVSDVEESCKIEVMVKVSTWGPMTCNEKCSCPQVQSQEVKGIDIKWRPNRCGVWEGPGQPGCWFENATNMFLCHGQNSDEAISPWEVFDGELHI